MAKEQSYCEDAGNDKLAIVLNGVFLKTPLTLCNYTGVNNLWTTQSTSAAVCRCGCVAVSKAASQKERLSLSSQRSDWASLCGAPLHVYVDFLLLLKNKSYFVQYFMFSQCIHKWRYEDASC